MADHAPGRARDSHAPVPARLIDDRQFWAALAAGPAACLVLVLLTPLVWAPGWPGMSPRWLALIIVYPLLEEIVFRGGLQPWMARRWHRRWGTISGANLGTSLMFAAAHLFFHPPLWAAAVFLPSLVFGYFRERHGNLAPAIILHVVYNASYYTLLA